MPKAKDKGKDGKRTSAGGTYKSGKVFSKRQWQEAANAATNRPRPEGYVHGESNR